MDLDGPASTGKGLSARWIARALDDSLRRLQTDARVDLYMPHGWDPAVPLDETLDAFDRAVRAGKVRVAGCSNFSGAQLEASLERRRRSRAAAPGSSSTRSSTASSPGVSPRPTSSRPPRARASPCWRESPLAGRPAHGQVRRGSGARPARGMRGRRLPACPAAEAGAAAVVTVLRRAAALEGATTPAQAALGLDHGQARSSRVRRRRRVCTPAQLGEWRWRRGRCRTVERLCWTAPRRFWRAAGDLGLWS